MDAFKWEDFFQADTFIGQVKDLGFGFEPGMAFFERV